MSRVPRIRFKGFEEDWEQRKLGEIGSVAMCRRVFKYQTTESGDIPFFKIGSFGATPDAFIPKDLFEKLKMKYPYPEKGDVLISASGSIGRTVVFTGKDEYFQDSNIVWLKHDNSIINHFLKYLYSIVKWVGIEGTTIKRLYNDNILKTEVIIPTLSEQQKVSNYLDGLDHLITLHQRKLEKFKIIKKSMLENLFPQNGEKTPKIRFSGFTEDWEQRKLGEIAERIIRKNEKLESTLPLTISAQYGLIDQNEFFDKRIASKDVRGYYLIKKGEFAYNKSTSVDAPLGAIKRLDKYKNGVLSTLYILFKIIDDTSTSSDYLVTYYATDLWHRGIQSIAAEGARNHGLLNIAPNDFFETMLSIPLNISEQKKVGDFFISLNHLITLHQSKLDKLQKIKKSMLESMFV